jgi:hypothetical protein
VSADSERDRIVTALDAIGAPGELPHGQHSWDEDCPVCLGSSEQIADALLGAGLVLRRAAEGPADALQRLAAQLTTDVRDWSSNPNDAWIYGALVGWDCEEQHQHDTETCGADEAMKELAEQFGWTGSRIESLRDLRRVIARWSGGNDTASTPPADSRGADAGAPQK